MEAAQPNDQLSAEKDIVVLGKRVRGTAIGEVQPTAVLDQQAIRSLAATSIDELLKRVKGLTTSSNGGDPVFLLNGRRVSSFGEMRSIPPEAIDRMEVLPEQEAARFGFSAMVKVVNLITKTRFQAVTTQEVVSTATDGGGANTYIEAASTRIDGGRRTSLSLSYARQDPILQSQRRIVPDPDTVFALGGNVTGVGGASIDPALDALAGRAVTVAAVPERPELRGSLESYVPQANEPAITDIGRYRTLMQKMDTVRVDGTIASPLGRTMSGSLNLSMEAQRSAGLNGLAPAVLDVPAGGVLPFADDVLLYRYLPGAVLHNRARTLNLHAGTTLQGSVRRWAWNVTGTHDRIRSSAFGDVGVPLDSLQSSIDAGGDPLAPIDPAETALRISDYSQTVTGTFATKAVANGPLLRLPAGDAMMTITADYARSTSRGTQPGIGNPALMLARTIKGGNVSVTIPIAAPDQGKLSLMGRMTANASAGVSDVSKYGRLTSVSYGLTWAPAPAVQLVASFDDARSPPPIALLSAPTIVAPNVPFFDFTTGASGVVTTVTGGNPSLSPERRRVTTIGLAVTPTKSGSLRINLDYLATRTTDQTGSLGSATAAFQMAFPDQFQRDATGRLVRVDLRPVNLALERERKVRLGFNVWTQLGAASSRSAPTASTARPKPRPGIFASLTTTYRLENQLVVGPGLAALDLLDGATLNGTGGRPRWEAEGNLSFSYGPVNTGIYGQLQGSTRIRSDLAASDLRFSGRTLLVYYGALDMETLVKAGWTRKLSTQLTIDNLLNDRIDVRDGFGRTPNRFQQAYLDPLGRTIKFSVRKLF